jgi:hypothetical protein
MPVAAIAAKLDGLQAQVEDRAARVETLAASGPPPAADTLQPRTVGGQRKLTPRQQRALRDKHRRGVSVPALQEEYGISRASVFRYLHSDKRAARRVTRR